MTTALRLPERDVWTVDNLAELPEDLPYELINGRLILLSPSNVHQFIVRRLLVLLEENCPPNLEPLGESSLDVTRYCQPQPDVVVIDTAHFSQHPTPAEAAVLAIEVVSPDSRDRDRREKVAMYATAGIGLYWIIDPLGDKISLTEMMLDRSRRRYLTSVEITGVFTTELPYSITIDLPALTARRDALMEPASDDGRRSA
jgi:Uma2 family endonuclease